MTGRLATLMDVNKRASSHHEPVSQPTAVAPVGRRHHSPWEAKPIALLTVEDNENTLSKREEYFNVRVSTVLDAGMAQDTVCGENRSNQPWEGWSELL